MDKLKCVSADTIQSSKESRDVHIFCFFGVQETIENKRTRRYARVVSDSNFTEKKVNVR